MKYLLIKQDGTVKEFERLPRSMNPKDTLINIKTEKVLNKMFTLTDKGITKVEPISVSDIMLKKTA